MHILEPKHILMKFEESEKLLKHLNISPIQLPKIKIGDPALPEGSKVGDIIKIERKDSESEKTAFYYRVIVV